MSTSNFQWRHDGLRWRIKLMQNLLTLLMEQSWHPESVTVSRKRMELAAVKEYLDEHFTEKIMLEELAEKFFINKFYLSKIFKETYGTTVNNYLISKGYRFLYTIVYMFVHWSGIVGYGQTRVLLFLLYS